MNDDEQIPRGGDLALLAIVAGVSAVALVRADTALAMLLGLTGAIVATAAVREGLGRIRGVSVLALLLSLLATVWSASIFLRAT